MAWSLRRRLAVGGVILFTLFAFALGFAITSGMLLGIHGFLLGMVPFTFLAIVLLLAIPLVPIVLLWYTVSRLLGIPMNPFPDEDEQESEPETPLEQLKNRYAAGEITESEFERQVDRLLDVEDRETDTRVEWYSAERRERERSY